MRPMSVLFVTLLLSACGAPLPDSVKVEDLDTLVEFYGSYDCVPGGADAALFGKHRDRLVASGKYKTGTISLPQESSEEEMWSHANKVWPEEAKRKALLRYDAKAKAVIYLVKDVNEENEIKSAMDLLMTKY